MADRNIYNSTTVGTIGGDAYMDQIAAKLGILFNAMTLKMATIAHSGNQYTITVDPVLNADVGEGMGFFVKPDANNTGVVTLRITTGNPYYSVTKPGGVALIDGEWNTATWYYVVFLGGAFRIISTISDATVNSVAIYQAFTASGTWTKPAGLSNDAIVIVEAWGAGGGGGRGASAAVGGGGGGGGYVRKELRAGDLTSSVSVTVGAGGAGSGTNNTKGTVGANSSFGGYVVAYGGGAGGGTSMGGAGGGATSAGTSGNDSTSGSATGGGPVTAPTGFFGASTIALAYGGSYNDNSGSPLSAGAIFGGGAGAGVAAGASNAGDSVYGGAGGASNTHAAGASVFGGAGGAFGVAGSAPGGGGGGTAAGGRGEVRVRVIP